MTGIVFGLIVFMVALVAVIGFGAVLHWRQHSTTSLLPYIFYLAINNMAWQVAISGRNLFASTLSDSADLIEPVLDMPPAVLWASRLTSLFIVVVAVERIVNRLLHYGQGIKIPTGLFVAFVFYFMSSVLFSAFLGTHPSLSHEYFYLFLGGIAALLFTEADADNAICSARNAIFMLLLASAMFVVIKPELVMRNDYMDGLIPGLTIRYVGLTAHSNVLGPLTVVFLLCLWSRPYSRGWLNGLAWFIGAATLICAQSKTSWLTFILCLSCLAYFRYAAFLKGYFFDFKRPVFLAAFLSVGMVVVTMFAMTLMFGSAGNPLSTFFMSRAGADLMTLTGRDEIWAIAVREWRYNPLFGYGLSIWNEAHRSKIGMPNAVTAHNQFYQTLSSAGIVGVVGLCFYVLTLFWFALKTAKASQGLTLAFFIMVMMRSVSEVTLSMIGYYGPEELTHVLILMVITSHWIAHRAPVANSQATPKFILAR
ncbi:O-antigen ligase family protein [Crenothrix sp.]|uniref:O-antigen ligase family protein n=1 Tax=Crenothrix sp. TaxID=3100433 RepID=UPI00374CAEE4